MGPAVMYTSSTVLTFVVARGADGLDRPVAHGCCAGAAAVRVALRPLLRQGDSRPLRAHPGAALHGERHHPGVAVGRPRGARLPPGAIRARSVSRRQRRIRPPQPLADRPAGDVLPEHGAADGDRRAARAVAGQPRSGARPDDDWRAGGVQRLPGDAGVADDCLWLGHQPAAAGDGVVEAAARDLRRGAGGVRRRGVGGRAADPGGDSRRDRIPQSDVRVRRRTRCCTTCRRAFPPGTTTAIVGGTGAGKSTLLDLLARLHEPPPGTVFVDGHDVRHLPLAVLRGAIGFVPQEPFLFSATLAENITFGEPAAPAATPAGRAPGSRRRPRAPGSTPT